jgi:hypothetical protein
MAQITWAITTQQPDPPPGRNVHRPPGARAACPVNRAEVAVYEGEDAPPRFQRADLTEQAQRGIVVPRLMCRELLYPGRVHSISGAPEGGKTTFALWAAVEVMRARGKVMMIDEESGQEMTADKLVALGVNGEMPQMYYYPFPGSSWSTGDIAALHELAAHIAPDLMIFDSAGMLLALAGLNENDNSEVNRFYRKLFLPLARDIGAAVLVIDHDTKDGNRSRYAAGARAKLGAIDVQYKVETIARFSRTQPGSLRLEVTKDRPGWLHPLVYHVTVSSALDITFLSDADAAALEARSAQKTGNGMGPAAEKILDRLNGTPATVKQITNRIAAKYKHGLRRETVVNALERLVADGKASPAEPSEWSGEPTWIKAGASPADDDPWTQPALETSD